MHLSSFIFYQSLKREKEKKKKQLMDLSHLNNEFCDPKFHIMFLIFMPLILSFEEVEEKKELSNLQSLFIPYKQK